MNSLALTIAILLCGLTLWLLYELTKLGKNIANKNYNHERSDIVFLIALLSLIILIVPYFFTLPIFDAYKSKNGSTGEIGDTIGGLTSPFINGIGALLVYLAFKEQVKATNQTRNLELYKIINDRLNWLKSDPYNIVEIEDTIYAKLQYGFIPQHPFNKATYILLEFEELYNIASKNTDEKENLFRQIQYLYRILYRDRFITIEQQSITFSFNNDHHTDLMIITDFILSFRKTDKRLGV